jgi:aconitate hydratase 2/2-methylisocitrate dehydratase
MDFRDVVHATQSQMLKQFGGENVFGSNYRGALGTLTADPLPLQTGRLR